MSEPAKLVAAVDAVIADPGWGVRRAIVDYRAGNQQAINYLTGLVLRRLHQPGSEKARFSDDEVAPLLRTRLAEGP